MSTDQPCKMTPASKTHSVCLVTPGNVASNPRLVKEAHALRDTGYRLRIVSADTILSLSPYDAKIFDDLGCDHVRVSAHAPRWRHTVRAVLQRTARQGMKRLGDARAGLGLASWAHHQLSHALGNAAMSEPADLYLAHNLAALPAAARAAAHHGARLGFDAEDFHCGELDESPVSATERAARTIIERTLLPRCQHLTAAAPGIARQYQQRYGVTMETILNVFPLAEAPLAPASPQAGEGPSLYWFSQTVGAERGLEAVVRAMGQMRVRARLRLRGNPSPGYADTLQTLARRVGGEDLARRIDLLPIAPPSEMARLAAGHNVGLALEPTRPLNRALCLTNKIFVYLLAGLPVCLSRTPAQTALATELGEAAWVTDIDDPATFARSLDDHLGDPGRLQRARLAAWGLARSRYNWDVEQRRFLSVVERSLQSGPS